GLVGMIPKEAVFYLERRGHTAVRKAFLASNLGKMATDDAINQFVHGSRVQIGKMIVRNMFDLDEAEAIAKHQQILHKFLLPFWHNPSTMFVVLDDEMESSPGMGFICVTGKYAKETRSALELLMKIGVPPAGTESTRQSFTHKSGTITWRGVAKRRSVFNLANDPLKKSDSLFMVHWAKDVLYIATSLRAADAIGRTFTKGGKPKNKIHSQNLQVVMKKTAMKDWAFRWYFNVEMLMKMFKKKVTNEEAQLFFNALGLYGIRGMGGVGGYADNVYTRLTYIYAPKADGGLVRMFKPGGSYKAAFAMTPSESTFCLAGQLDKKALTKMITAMIMASKGVPFGGKTEVTVEGVGGPAIKPAEKKVDEKTAKIIKQIEALIDASDGNVAGFVTELQAMVGMMGGGGPPVGAVLGIKDRAKAVNAIDELIKLAGGAERQNEVDAEGRPAPAKQYRKIPIRHIGEMVRIVVMKDRAVIALNDNALKSAIDTALDKTGGFEPNSKGKKLLKLTGDGSGIFVMDLAAITKLFWPMLMQAVQSEGAQEFFPLASLPSTNKMVRMLGPEIAVFKPDREGLLLKSRGKIPFSTKFVLLYPMMGTIMFGF
ncbi:MAG: hypothetical protein KAV00_09765, partial [Phycisphaerae bacterium]|nr:hypothetical protein [Phycisphaerae bacterium]